MCHTGVHVPSVIHQYCYPLSTPQSTIFACRSLQIVVHVAQQILILHAAVVLIVDVS